MPASPDRIKRLEGELKRLEKSLSRQAEMIIDLRAAHGQTVTALKSLVGPKPDNIAVVLASLDTHRR